jgi:hypothetical protein
MITHQILQGRKESTFCPSNNIWKACQHVFCASDYSRSNPKMSIDLEKIIYFSHYYHYFPKKQLLLQSNIHTMKRAISFFLLMLVMLIAVQPSLALHFCRGQLRSVAIGQSSKSCCGKAMEMEMENQENAISNKCCSTYTIKIATDDFQPSAQQSIIEIQQQIQHPVLFLCESLLKGNEPGASLSFKHFFPPGGLARYSVDLLTSICIFRI